VTVEREVNDAEGVPGDDCGEWRPIPASCELKRSGVDDCFGDDLHWFPFLRRRERREGVREGVREGRDCGEPNIGRTGLGDLRKYADQHRGIILLLYDYPPEQVENEYDVQIMLKSDEKYDPRCGTYAAALQRGVLIAKKRNTEIKIMNNSRTQLRIGEVWAKFIGDLGSALGNFL